jgi:hypothetical protein
MANENNILAKDLQFINHSFQCATNILKYLVFKLIYPELIIKGIYANINIKVLDPGQVHWTETQEVYHTIIFQKPAQLLITLNGIKNNEKVQNFIKIDVYSYDTDQDTLEINDRELLNRKGVNLPTKCCYLELALWNGEDIVNLTILPLIKPKCFGIAQKSLGDQWEIDRFQNKLLNKGGPDKYWNLRLQKWDAHAENSKIVQYRVRENTLYKLFATELHDTTTKLLR